MHHFAPFVTDAQSCIVGGSRQHKHKKPTQMGFLGPKHGEQELCDTDWEALWPKAMVIRK